MLINNENIKLKPYNKYNVPLILEIPRYLNDNINSYIIAKGRPNTTYQIVFDTTNFSIKTDKDGYYIHKICLEDFPIRNSVLKEIKLKSYSLNLYNSSRVSRIIVSRDNTPTRNLSYRPIDMVESLMNGKNNEYNFVFKNQIVYTTNGVVGF